MISPEQRRRILFFSSNGSWGGSEILWSKTAETLVKDGHEVRAWVGYDLVLIPGLEALRSQGCRISGGWFISNRIGRGHSFGGRLLRAGSRFFNVVLFRLMARRLRRYDLIVISQGDNRDGVALALICRQFGLPYVLISHKASEMSGPTDSVLEKLRDAYLDARHVYFVSRHNLRVTEEQLGRHLPSTSIVRNPYLVNWYAPPPPWPETSGAIRLACVGRLWSLEKGQDILLRVLSLPKWRERPLSVTFFGAGPQRLGLEGMARFLGVTAVTFAGFVEDVASIWNTHHALVLPSRAEGLPLTIVEAMLCGRPCIVTDVAGNSEVVEDERTGFIVATPTEADLDEALERAWRRLEDWPAMGLAAAASIRQLTPPDPSRRFADTLLEGIIAAGPDGHAPA